MARTGGRRGKDRGPTGGSVRRALAGKFGLGHKVRLIEADSLGYDFGGVGPLEFARLSTAPTTWSMCCRTRKRCTRCWRRAGAWSGMTLTADVPWVEVNRGAGDRGIA